MSGFSVVLWQSKNEKWLINKVMHPRTRRIQVEVTDGWMAQYPILYDGGDTVGYDDPFIIPKYVRNQIRKIMVNMREAGTLGEYIKEEVTT
jgi:hypothetical protein